MQQENTPEDKTEHYTIGAWRFEVTTKCLLHRDGHSVKLEDKIAKLLHTFCIHKGTIVSKDELITAVWDGREVSEQTIPVAISKLRKALGDDINNPKMLATVPRQGYKLLDETAPGPARTKPSLSAYISSFILIALLTVIYIFTDTNQQPMSPERIQLASATKPGIIVTINDVRTTENTKDRIHHAIAISELSSFFLAQIPDILVIRHWWNLDAPDPTGGIYTRYGPATPVYSLKANLIADTNGDAVTFILSDPKTDEVIWSGLHTVANGSSGLFAMFTDMLVSLNAGNKIITAAAPTDDLRFWNARYRMQLSNPRAAKRAAQNLTELLSDTPPNKTITDTTKALLARWQGTLENTEILSSLLPKAAAEDAKNDSASTHLALVDSAALSLYRDNNPVETIKLLEEALKRAPGDHYALSLYGEANAAMGNTDAAITAYKKAIRLAPYARAYSKRLSELENRIVSK